jgi:lipopolysaccharide biosynthesis glycosyltransferase
MTAIAFFADRNVIVALHVALASTLAHWRGPDALEIHLFHDGLPEADLVRLRETIDLAGKPAVFQPAPVDLARVRGWRSLYGSHMPYGRLFLPELMPEHQEVLYLDADVIVEMDVRDILRARGDDAVVSAMKAWDFAHSHDAELASELGIGRDEPYFHSGLLIMQLERWRQEELTAKCIALGDRYAQRLNSHDQTILNLVCHGRIDPLPDVLTSHLYPSNDLGIEYGQGTIRNFCGSPKPFDPLGNVLNVHFGLFNQWLAHTAIAGWSPNSIGQVQHIRRNLRLLKPMIGTALRIMASRIRGRR